MSSTLNPPSSNLSSSRPDVFSPDWKVVGPGGGGCGINPVISPHDKNVFFSATDMQPLYRSDDAGATWRTFDCSKIRGTSSPVTFHPTDPKVLYVGILGGLMKSTDGGFEWKKVFGRVWREIVDIGRCVLIDPRNPDTVYAAFDHMGQKSHSFFARSDDAGATWRGHLAARPPSSPSTISSWTPPQAGSSRPRYAGTSPSQGLAPAFRPRSFSPKTAASPGRKSVSPRAGSSTARWLCAKASRASSPSCAPRSKRKKVIGGLFRSDNLGKTWKPLNSAFDLTVGCNMRSERPAPAMEFRKFAVAPSDPDVIYVPLVAPRQGARVDVDGLQVHRRRRHMGPRPSTATPNGAPSTSSPTGSPRAWAGGGAACPIRSPSRRPTPTA